jgi:hypothetical protein
MTNPKVPQGKPVLLTKDQTKEWENDPLTLAVNRAFNTGEVVEWNLGDKLPDPEGPIKPIEDF